jgi:hypothetical protein
MRNALGQNNVFSNLKKLKILNLKSVGLNKSDIELFADLHGLESLDISSNNLQYIDFIPISELENLNVLNLYNNSLSTLKFNELNYIFPELKSIDISENNWICADLITVLTMFQNLNIKIKIAKSNLIKTGTNIRGIRCTNVTQIMLYYDRDLTMSNNINIELNEMLNRFQNDNVMLKMQITEINNKLAEIEHNVKPNRDTNEINVIIDKLRNVIMDEILNTTQKILNSTHHRLDTTANKINVLETSIFNKIDSNFSKLYDIKLCLIAAVLVIGVIVFTISVQFVIHKRCSGRNMDLYNNYKFPVIHCSKSKEELLNEQNLLP